MDAYNIILAAHVFSGFLALGVGLVPMLSAKGSKLHIFSGRIYFWAMFGVFLTTSTMYFFKPDHLLFLFLIGIFSFHNTFSGSRIVRYQKNKGQVSLLDWVVGGCVAIAGITMISMGVLSFLNDKMPLGILYTVFGSVCLSNAIKDIVFFYKYQLGNGISNPKSWLYRHISRMGGSYIATVTAFFVVNNTLLPNLVVWLAPGIIGAVLISLSIRKIKYKRKKMKVAQK